MGKEVQFIPFGWLQIYDTSESNYSPFIFALNSLSPFESLKYMYHLKNVRYCYILDSIIDGAFASKKKVFSCTAFIQMAL